MTSTPDNTLYCAACLSGFKLIEGCDEWGSANEKDKRGRLQAVSFCYDCWEDEVDNCFYHHKLGIQIWDKFLRIAKKQWTPAQAAAWSNHKTQKTQQKN